MATERLFSPAGPRRHLSLQHAIGLLVLAAAIGASVWALDDVYLSDGHLRLLPGIGAAALVSVLLWVFRGPGWSAIPLQLVAFTTIGGAVIFPGSTTAGLPLLATWREIWSHALSGWSDLLSLPLPIEATDELLALPMFLAWMATAVAAELSLRTRRPALATLPVLVAVTLFAALGPVGRPGWATMTAVIAGLVAHLWLAGDARAGPRRRGRGRVGGPRRQQHRRTRRLRDRTARPVAGRLGRRRPHAGRSSVRHRPLGSAGRLRADRGAPGPRVASVAGQVLRQRRGRDRAPHADRRGRRGHRRRRLPPDRRARHLRRCAVVVGRALRPHPVGAGAHARRSHWRRHPCGVRTDRAVRGVPVAVSPGPGLAPTHRRDRCRPSRGHPDLDPRRADRLGRALPAGGRAPAFAERSRRVRGEHRPRPGALRDRPGDPAGRGGDLPGRGPLRRRGRSTGVGPGGCARRRSHRRRLRVRHPERARPQLRRDRFVSGDR